MKKTEKAEKTDVFFEDIAELLPGEAPEFEIIVTSEEAYEIRYKLDEPCDSPLQAEHAIDRIYELRKQIGPLKRAYEDELEALKQKYDELLQKQKMTDKIETTLKEFALSIKEGLEDGVFKLSNGKMKFVKSTVPSLEIGIETPVLIAALKAAFPSDPVYYLNFIKVSTEPKKTEIKNAVKSNILSAEFCKANLISLGYSEKYELEITKG